MPTLNTTMQTGMPTPGLLVERYPLRPREREALLDAIHACLAAHGLPRLAEQVVLSFDRRGILRIDGCVGSYYLKQLVQEIALRSPDVHQVENRLSVGTRTKARRRPLAGRGLD